MYSPSTNRYDEMVYRRCGKSGLQLPVISLGLWHNFGFDHDFVNGKNMVRKAFDLGITHFDLANNYGPPPGSAETNFGKILEDDFSAHRDEMIISTKAGYGMWAGPYGDFGSKKYLVSSLDQSLKRMKLDYVDIFYHHRPDPNTPLEETMGALDLLVRQGKALYVGISNYKSEQAAKACRILKELGTPCVIEQPRYSMFDRWIEADGLLDTLEDNGVGSIVFSPLAQGLLTNKYLNGIPADSRAAGASVFLNPNNITEDKISKIKALNEVAESREQSLAQMAISWVLRDERVTSALIGASKVAQIEELVQVSQKLQFSEAELQGIEQILED